MKTGMMVSALAVVSVMLFACSADEKAVQGSEANVTEAPPGAPSAATTPPAAPPPAATAGIAACGNKKPCVDAFVLKTLFASDFRLKEVFNIGLEGNRGAEYVAHWLAATETRATIRIRTTPLDGGKTKAHISLGDHDVNGGTESGCSFDVTIDGDRIVETEVEAFCAG